MNNHFKASISNISYCLLLIASFTLVSCSHSEFSDFEETESGLLYKFHVKGDDTTHPKYDEVVRVKMARRLGDSILESTESIGPDGVEQLLRKPVFNGAIEEGIAMMAIGDSATFMILTDSINKYFPAKDSTKNFKPNSYLAFDVKLMNIQTREEAMLEREARRLAYVQERKEKEPKELNQYIQDNHIEVKPGKNGLYYIEKEKGKGASPKDGDSVTVHYTGSFLDGTIFGSSFKQQQPMGFIVGGKGENSVVEGWNEAIKMMKKGTIATIIIPSALAYDSTGYRNPQTGKYFIPPYAPMKFDIQLLDIISKNKL